MDPRKIKEMIDREIKEAIVPRRKFTAEEISGVQEWMVKQGYGNIDPKAHRMLAAFLASRKYKQATKGLLLIGKCGVGKTYWLEKFSGCKVMSATKLVKRYKEAKQEFYDIIEPPTYDSLPDRYWDMAIDDIGEEPTLNDFGTKLEVIAEVLSVRYRVFQRHGGKSYISSNLDLAEIANRYGSRIESRLHEMCTHIPFKCEDQRRK